MIPCFKETLSHKGSPAARKFILRIGFALALGATATGCAVGPQYHRPTVKLQPFHNAPSIEARTAYQSTESMSGRVAAHLPGYDRHQNYYDLGFIASWETDLFGGLKKGAEAAAAEAQAAEALHAGTRITIAAEAADAYMQIRGAQARLNFAKDQISTDKHLVELVQQRRDAGIASDAVASERDSSTSHGFSRGTAEPAGRSHGRAAGNVRSGTDARDRHSRCTGNLRLRDAH